METRGRKAYIQRNYLKDEYVQKWLVGLAEKTKRNYIFAFKDWLDFVVMTPTEQIQRRIQDTISPDLTQRFFFESKWREYKAFMEEKGTLSDASIKAYLKTVASFFARNSLPLVLKRGDWETTQTQRAIRQRWTPTNEEIRKMYSHANLRDRSLLLCLYHSGLSEIDVVNLRIEDLEGLYDCPEGEHFFIEKPREKTGNIQATCLSFESVHDIKALLQEMGNPQEGFIFISTTRQTTTGLKVRAVHEAIKGLVERAFGEEKVQEFKTKSLRSSYNSALLRANIQPQELKDVMMGHKRRGARANYAYDEITIKESYTRIFQFLTINGIQNRKDIQDLRTTQLTQAKLLSQIGEENEKQKAEIEGQKQEIEELKANYEKLEHMLELVAKGEVDVLKETQEDYRKRKQQEKDES